MCVVCFALVCTACFGDRYAKLPLDRKLKVACQHGDLQNAEFFLLQGADVNFTTLAGSTPLMDAVWYGHSHVVDFLLRSGANIEHKVRL